MKQDSTREALVAACSSFIQRGDEEPGQPASGNGEKAVNSLEKLGDDWRFSVFFVFFYGF